jgi:hypothetical protein
LDELIFVIVLSAAFTTGFVLRYFGMTWFVAWFIASLIIPTILYINELVDPTGGLGIAILFGGVCSFVLGGAGVFAAWLVRRRWGGAKQPNDQPAP